MQLKRLCCFLGWLGHIVWLNVDARNQSEKRGQCYNVARNILCFDVLLLFPLGWFQRISISIRNKWKTVTFGLSGGELTPPGLLDWIRLHFIDPKWGNVVLYYRYWYCTSSVAQYPPETGRLWVRALAGWVQTRVFLSAPCCGVLCRVPGTPTSAPRYLPAQLSPASRISLCCKTRTPIHPGLGERSSFFNRSRMDTWSQQLSVCRRDQFQKKQDLTAQVPVI